MKLLLILVIGSFVSACATNTAETRRPEAKPTATAAPTATATPTPSSTAKTFNGRGVVTKIDLKIVSVELNHEEIKGLMPAMIMEFYVKEKSELEVLKVGDTVDFVLEDDRGQERIISIKKSK